MKDSLIERAIAHSEIPGLRPCQTIRTAQSSHLFGVSGMHVVAICYTHLFMDR